MANEAFRVRAAGRAATARLGTPAEAVARLEALAPKASHFQAAPEAPDTQAAPEGPVFIFSSGWRCGSTLLQRLVMSRDGVFVWGEPFDQEDLLGDLMAPLMRTAFGMSDKHVFFRGTAEPSTLSETWIATIAPDTEALRQAYRALLARLFGVEAICTATRRWGVKTVRLNARFWPLLNWVFPEARAVFLMRDPLGSYRSYRWRTHFARWPDRPVAGPAGYGAIWADLVRGFEAGRNANAMILRYEDLRPDAPQLAALEAHLGLGIDRGILGVKVGSSGGAGPLPWAERAAIRRRTGHLARRYGY